MYSLVGNVKVEILYWKNMDFTDWVHLEGNSNAFLICWSVKWYIWFHLHIPMGILTFSHIRKSYIWLPLQSFKINRLCPKVNVVCGNGTVKRFRLLCILSKEAWGRHFEILIRTDFCCLVILTFSKLIIFPSCIISVTKLYPILERSQLNFVLRNLLYHKGTESSSFIDPGSLTFTFCTVFE